MISKLKENARTKVYQSFGSVRFYDCIDEIVFETALAVVNEIQNRLAEEDDETYHWCEEGDGRSWCQEKIDNFKQEISVTE